ncbi:MAG: hypothetical protein Q8P67_06945 [archaeon]|nr:hypothetical protein [archaeon]
MAAQQQSYYGPPGGPSGSQQSYYGPPGGAPGPSYAGSPGQSHWGEMSPGQQMPSSVKYNITAFARGLPKMDGLLGKADPYVFSFYLFSFKHFYLFFYKKKAIS